MINGARAKSLEILPKLLIFNVYRGNKREPVRGVEPPTY